MSSFEFDAIVIGSGFGGAVSACRLAEHGMKVLVLERGRRWAPETYPRQPTDPWVWREDKPELFSGWADLRLFGDMSVLAGAGVGGGSLIYANVSIEAKPQAFDSGWPADISYEALVPYYRRVGDMLEVQELPDNQLTHRYRLMQEAAQKCGWGDRLRKVPLAVRFDPAFEDTQSGARSDRHSTKKPNRHGKAQGTCVHCGNCDIGCQEQAKNTLDLNYLAVAENKGAQIRPLHRVVKIEPKGSGYRVHYERIDPDAHRLERGSVTAQRVVLGAGSLGSTELLLRCRDQHGSLPGLSQRLGWNWAFNGDFVTPTFYSRKPPVSPSHGPTISAAIDLLDGTVRGEKLFIEDGGIPNLAAAHVQRHIKQADGALGGFWRELGEHVVPDDPLDNMMPWFGQGVDKGDGQLYLGRVWYAPWLRELKMHWDYRGSEAMVDAMVAAHKQLAAATGGVPFVPPTWTVLHKLITPHPLGGCNMGSSSADGVVDSSGRVFGHDNLYVMDGAIIPRPLGLNPSRTIAALAERCSELLCKNA